MPKLRVKWKKDAILDRAVSFDKKWRSCSKIARYVRDQPGHATALESLSNKYDRFRLSKPLKRFIDKTPGLFEIYRDRIKPNSELVPFIRISEGLHRFFEEEERIYLENEPFNVMKLCKLLMMTKDKKISAGKLDIVKVDFGFPDDFLVSLVPKYPQYFRLTKSPATGKPAVELVSWNPEFAKSVLQQQAEEKESNSGEDQNQIPGGPSFTVKLPRGFLLTNDMNNWVRAWMEIPYVSPYEATSGLVRRSVEWEKRTVGVLHELLSLSPLRRLRVNVLRRLRHNCEFYDRFSEIFTRHAGIFYLSLQGAVETAVLREAYKGSRLVDCDPLTEIKYGFFELLQEGELQRVAWLRARREAILKDLEMAAMKSKFIEK